MIHHDYLLRLIEEFARVLSRITDLKQTRNPREAARTIDEEVRALLGVDRESILRLGTAEILARIMRTGTALEVRNRTLFLVALLKESGDLANTSSEEEARGSEDYLKALQLLLDVLSRPDGGEPPMVIPTVDALVAALDGSALPPETEASLMMHYERIGEFARAENSLFHLIDASPGAPELAEFGIAFYGRLLEFNDTTLQRGNLPREEVKAGLRELQARAVA